MREGGTMVYPDPVFLIGGDSYITLELGDDGSLYLNLYILNVEKMMRAAEFPWLIDTTAARTTIMVQYDPIKIHADGVVLELRGLISSGVNVPEKVPSKLIHLPVLYNDPMTRECAKAHHMPPNLEVIAEENNISPEDVIRIHSHPRYFISYTCFTYGSFGAFPIDHVMILKNSKYKLPRKWTPAGALGMGGTTTNLYATSSPGGVMLLGHVPVRTFDTACRNKYFREHRLLVHPGDTIRFHPISENEHDYIIKHADEYVYRIDDITIGWRENADL